jgi:hypothetical protein
MGLNIQPTSVEVNAMAVNYVEVVSPIFVRGQMRTRILPKDVDSIHVDWEKERVTIEVKGEALTIFANNIAAISSTKAGAVAVPAPTAVVPTKKQTKPVEAA